MISPNHPDVDALIASMTDAQKREMIERIRRSMREGDADDAGPIGGALDAFVGGWSDEEADAIEKVVAEGRVIDPETWR